MTNHTATNLSILQHTATYCNPMQHTAIPDLHQSWCWLARVCALTLMVISLQHTATHCNTLQHTATPYDTRQHCSAHYNTLQHIASKRVNTDSTPTAKHFNTLHSPYPPSPIYTPTHIHTHRQTVGVPSIVLHYVPLCCTVVFRKLDPHTCTYTCANMRSHARGYTRKAHTCITLTSPPLPSSPKIHTHRQAAGVPSAGRGVGSGSRTGRNSQKCDMCGMTHMWDMTHMCDMTHMWDMNHMWDMTHVHNSYA